MERGKPTPDFDHIPYIQRHAEIVKHDLSPQRQRMSYVLWYISRYLHSLSLEQAKHVREIATGKGTYTSIQRVTGMNGAVFEQYIEESAVHDRSLLWIGIRAAAIPEGSVLSVRMPNVCDGIPVADTVKKRFPRSRPLPEKPLLWYRERGYIFNLKEWDFSKATSINRVMMKYQGSIYTPNDNFTSHIATVRDETGEHALTVAQQVRPNQEGIVWMYPYDRLMTAVSNEQLLLNQSLALTHVLYQDVAGDRRPGPLQPMLTH